MGRIRSIKPELPQSRTLGRVSRDCRLCFVLLFTLADDEGRMRGDSDLLASLLFPYDEDARATMPTWLRHLEGIGAIRWYEADGQPYVQIVKWTDHQRVEKPKRSAFPAPPEMSSTVPGHVADTSPTAPGQGAVGREGKGREEEGKGRDEEARALAPAAVVVSSSSFTPKLTTSSLDYHKARQAFSFMGQRLKVPHKLHGECRDKLGGSDPDVVLAEWYGLLDADLQQSGEPVPDVFVWLRPKFVAFCAGLVTRQAVRAQVDGHAADAAYHAERQAARERQRQGVA